MTESKGLFHHVRLSRAAGNGDASKGCCDIPAYQVGAKPRPRPLPSTDDGSPLVSE